MWPFSAVLRVLCWLRDLSEMCCWRALSWSDKVLLDIYYQFICLDGCYCMVLPWAVHPASSRAVCLRICCLLAKTRVLTEGCPHCCFTAPCMTRVVMRILCVMLKNLYNLELSSALGQPPHHSISFIHWQFCQCTLLLQVLLQMLNSIVGILFRGVNDKTSHALKAPQNVSLSFVCISSSVVSVLGPGSSSVKPVWRVPSWWFHNLLDTLFENPWDLEQCVYCGTRGLWKPTVPELLQY